MWLAAHRRRAAWSPDGLFAVVPAGLYQSSAASAPYYVSHVIARRNPTKSFALLPSGRKPSIAVKFCPTLFKLSRHGGKEAVGEGVPTPEKLFATPLKGSQAAQDAQSGFNMPYKMIFAVATTNSILVYDTEQVSPGIPSAPFPCLSLFSAHPLSLFLLPLESSAVLSLQLLRCKGHQGWRPLGSSVQHSCPHTALQNRGFSLTE